MRVLTSYAHIKISMAGSNATYFMGSEIATDRTSLLCHQ